MGVTVLDTSVLIAMVDASDTHHVAARAAVRSARDAGDEFVVPVAAYAEFMVRSYQEDDVSMIAFRDGLFDAIPARVEPATRETGRLAAAVRARHGQRVKLPDALIIATAIVVAADRILTADARWPAQDVPVIVLEAT